MTNFSEKLDFKGHLQRIPKPISDQEVFIEMKSKDQAILEIFYKKESNKLIDTNN